jgi:hypothetical protein
MNVDRLRGCWPEQVLTGRYSFGTRRRDEIAQNLLDAAGLLTGGLIDARKRHVVYLRVEDRPVLIVLTRTYRQWPHLPPGIKVCGTPAAPVMLALHEHRHRRPFSLAALLEPTVYDVVDHLFGEKVGTLVCTGGLIQPAHTLVRDASGRPVGRLDQVSLTRFGRWLTPGEHRYEIRADGLPVAWVGPQRRRSAREIVVDASANHGRLDPRLIVACVLHRIHHLSDY